MISLVLKSIIQRGSRSLLLIVGVLVVSAAFGILLAAVETTKVTVDENIAKHWRTTYDILVRPLDSRSSIELKHGLVQANHLSNLEGGITLDQYEAISAIPDIEVAAPIAILGNFNLVFHTPIEVSCAKPGFYRLQNKVIQNDGLQDYQTTGEGYFYCSEPGGQFKHLFEDYFYNWTVLSLTGNQNTKETPWFEEVVYQLPVLLAAVDPEQEGMLVGLDQAIVEGEYLHDLKSPLISLSILDIGPPDIPFILNQDPYVNFSLATTWERLDLPFNQEILVEIEGENGREFLASQPRESLINMKFPGPEAFEIVITSLRDSPLAINHFSGIKSGVEYQESSFELEENTLTLEATSDGAISPGTRVVSMTRVSSDFQLAFRYSEMGRGYGGDMRFILQGLYDIEELPRPEDVSRVPLETYYPPMVELRYDDSVNPIPPVALGPTFSDAGYITSPPLALTTLKSASTFGFNTAAPISAIRVRVSGIDEFNEEAQARIEAVAAEIINLTDLDVDITVGSSPRRILVHLAGYANSPGIGFVEEGWVQMGLSYALASEINRVNILLFTVMFIVAGLYVLNTSLISTLSRQKEIALQKALGWRDSSVFLQVVLEGILVGVVAATLGLIVAIGLSTFLELDMPIERAALVLPMGVGLCLIGSLIPAYIASRTSPSSMLARGEVLDRVRLEIQSPMMAALALRQVLRRRARALLAILTTFTSTVLITIYAGGVVHSRGYLTGTLLGEHILVHIGGFHLAIAGVSILVAGISVADVLLMAVTERKREIGVLKAIGWRSVDVAKLFLSEGAVLSFAGGLAGVVLGIIIMSTLFTVPWVQMTLIGVFALSIPVCVGAISAIVPARIASRTTPAEAVRYE